jgi:NADH-quinone oxidoreductase subunit C
MNELLNKEIETIFKDILLSDSGDKQVVVITKHEQVHTVLRFLKDKGFDHLTLLSAVDWIEDKEFELVYILTRYMQSDEEHTDLVSAKARRAGAGQERLHLIVKTRISRQSPQLETVTGIFSSAEPYEREIHELFGIKFEGHKRLIPLLLERDYKIPPFRKDFDTRKYVEEIFGQIPFVEDKNK